MASKEVDKTVTGIPCYNFVDQSTNKGFETKFHFAKTQGLTGNYIMQLIRKIESKETDEEVKFKLIEYLIPRETVPEEAFIRMTCLLSNLKFCLQLKVEILKWMITAYPFKVEVPCGSFRYLYEIFLNLLEQEKLRPYVCHFLCVITQKDQVTPKRVGHIFKLIEKYEKQPFFVMVLHSYFILCPEYFEDEIDEDFEYEFESLGIYPSLFKCVHPSYEQPSVHVTTQEINSSEMLLDSSAVTVENIVTVEKSHDVVPFRPGSFHEISQEFKTLEMSTDVSKILKSRLRRLFLTSDLPPKIKIKLYDYISTSLYQNLDSCKHLEDILEIFHDMQHSVPAASDFTEALVSSWDSTLNTDIVTEFLNYEPISCFEKIGYKMDLVREKLLKSSVPIKCQLLNCFSKIYLNWILMENSDNSYVPCDGRCFASNNNSNSSTAPEIHLSSDEIYKLGSYIDLICSALLLDDSHPCLLNEILLHYERVSIAHMKADRNLVIQLPMSSVFHLALFSLSEFTLDNLSRLMLRYNAEICHMHTKSNPEAELATHFFNLCARDLRRFLLRGSCTDDENTYLSRTNVFMTLKEKCQNFASNFVLYRHPALFLKIMDFVSKNPMSNFQINPDARLNFFRNIAEDGPEKLIKLVTLLM